MPNLNAFLQNYLHLILHICERYRKFR